MVVHIMGSADLVCGRVFVHLSGLCPPKEIRGGLRVVCSCAHAALHPRWSPPLRVLFHAACGRAPSFALSAVTISCPRIYLPPSFNFRGDYPVLCPTRSGAAYGRKIPFLGSAGHCVRLPA